MQDIDTPGPGQYTDKKVLANTPRATIGKANKSFIEPNANPGPGSYENFKSFKF